MEASSVTDGTVALAIVGLAATAIGGLVWILKYIANLNKDITKSFNHTLQEKTKADAVLSHAVSELALATNKQTNALDKQETRNQAFQNKMIRQFDSLHEHITTLADRNYEAINAMQVKEQHVQKQVVQREIVQNKQ